MYNISLIKGDGIGPEVSLAAKEVVDATGIEINWDILEAGMHMMDEYNTPLPEYVIESIKKNKIALKGPITTPIGKGFKSVNVQLRKIFKLYANVRPSVTIDGIETRYENVDLVVVRENTEGLYCGIEHMVNDDIAESIKIISRGGSERIARYAFEFAKRENRKKVTVVHKANIMKLSDGLFLESARRIAKEYSGIEFEEMIVDAMSMRLVQEPEQYDVLVMPNLYGDILSDMCSGLVGGLGVVPSANIGENEAIFEPVHGSAPDIAGKNMANPTAAILAASMMLKHIGETERGSIIENAVHKVLKTGVVKTCDIGGTASTTQFTSAVIKEVEKNIN